MRLKFIACLLIAFLLSIFTEGAESEVAVNGASAAGRHLIICLDGVGHEIIEEMRAEGHFDYLKNVSHMIAPFPSITNPSIVTILKPRGAPGSFGYEDFYYDLSARRMKGGLAAQLIGESSIKDTFWQEFHAHPSALTIGLEYMLPPISCWLEGRWAIGRLRSRFLKSSEPIYLVYIGATDSVAHTAGKRWLKDLLRALDKVLSDLHVRYPQVTISLFSDHGNQFMRYRRANLTRDLRSSGLRPKTKISDPSSFVQPAYGLIGSAVFYSQDEKKRELAQALARHEGVDFACFREGDAVYVVNAEGRAKITYSDGRLAYQTETADPLALRPIVQAMRAADVLNETGFAEDRAWLLWTQAHVYPDPLHRLWSAFGSYVANPASVIVNLKEGYYTGNELMTLFVRLRATHGNLRRAASLGFAASTRQTLPDYLRAQDLWPTLNASPPQSSDRLQ
jgi:hypothetical protein